MNKTLGLLLAVTLAAVGATAGLAQQDVMSQPLFDALFSYPINIYGDLIQGYGWSTPLSPPLPPAEAPPSPSFYVVQDGLLLQYDWNYRLLNVTKLPPHVPWPQGGATWEDVFFARENRWSAALGGLQAADYTHAAGRANFWADPLERGLHFQINVSNLQAVTEITLNLTDPNLPLEASPPVVKLYHCSPTGARLTGTLAQGMITDANLIGWLAGCRVPDLIQALNRGQATVVVRTARRPQGELVGRIRALA